MISLSVLFWMYIILFALIGATRGWAKEILVTSGVILALFLITILETFIPIFRDNLTETTSFWVRMVVLMLMTFFGYQGPNIPRMIDRQRFVRDRFEDLLLGSFLGGVNGYMIFGTAWYFLIQANYPFDWISPPDQLTEAGRNAIGLIEILPPQWLQPPLTYVAVGLAFVFILVVLI
jgi:hypothetical protein